MFRHDEIWNAIDGLARARGYSTSGLARKAGLDPTTFNKSKRHGPEGKLRWPSTESISKILAVTGTTMVQFLEYMDARQGGVPAKIPMTDFGRDTSPGALFAEKDRADLWTDLEFPALDREEFGNLFALKVRGDFMEPLYRENDVLIVWRMPEWTGCIRRGDRAVIITKGGRMIVQELSREEDGTFVFYALNPEMDDYTLRADEIEWMAKIIWASQ